MSKKIIVSDGNGKHQEISENYVSVDVDNNSISASILVANTASIPNSSTNKPVFLQNNILTTIPDPSSPNKFIKYTNADGFTTADIDTSALQGDLSGAFPTEQIKVTSVANVTGGILPLAYGGLGTNSFADAGLITTNGSFNLKSDNSINANQITLVKGAIAAAPVGLFGGNALSSSYDANTANHTGYIDIDDHAGNFTIECWVNLANVGGNTIVGDQHKSIIFQSEVGPTKFSLLISASAPNISTGRFGIWNGDLILAYNATNNFIPNQWTHCALVRQNSVYTAYINGTSSVSAAAGHGDTSKFTRIHVGTNGNGLFNINGYLSEFSMVKYAKTENEIKEYYNAVLVSTQGRINSGSVTTSYDTIGYKPAVLANLTASSGTDNSINANPITLVKGTIAAAPAGLFGGYALSSSYDANIANHTGYIDLTNHSGNFTLECWVNLANIGGSTDSNARCVIFESNSGVAKFALAIRGATSFGTVGTYAIWNGGTIVPDTNINFIANQWMHCALVRTGDFYKAYINGTGSIDVVAAQDSNSSFNKIYIGTNSNGLWNINGYMSEISMVKYAKTENEIKGYYNAVKAGTQGRLNSNSVTTTYDNVGYAPKALANLTQNPGHGPNRILKYNSSGILTAISKNSLNMPMLTQPIAYLYDGSYGTDNTYTWTKPSGCRFVKIMCQGGGGGGGARYVAINSSANGAGGGGGGFSEVILNALNLPDYVTITCGKGGLGSTYAGSSPADGQTGGNSSFGNYIFAYGGDGAGSGPSEGIGGGGYPIPGADGGESDASPTVGQSITYRFGGAGGGGSSRPGSVGPDMGLVSTTAGAPTVLSWKYLDFSTYYYNNTYTIGNFPALSWSGAWRGGTALYGSGGGGGTATYNPSGTSGGKGYVLVICY